MKVLVVAEYYPRAADPVLGVWAHRQALAARDAGADVRVCVLFRPRRRGDVGQPRLADLDGLQVEYALMPAPPPRSRTYGTWGAWAAPALKRSIDRAPVDLVHAHYAVPAGDAVRRATDLPYVVSDHGGDTLWTARRWPDVVRRGFEGARLVLANSSGTARRALAHGARATTVVHLGTDLPAAVPKATHPTIATVAHLVERKRHEDVLRAVREVPGLRYVVVGDGPERPRLEALARELGIDDRVAFLGQLAPAAARLRAQQAWAFVMPSVDEAFGVAYVEAMAGGVPCVGTAGEAGPVELAAAGTGIVLVRPRDPAALAHELRLLLAGERRHELGARARAVVERDFTWARCGEQTVAAYEAALA